MTATKGLLVVTQWHYGFNGATCKNSISNHSNVNENYQENEKKEITIIT